MTRLFLASTSSRDLFYLHLMTQSELASKEFLPFFGPILLTWLKQSKDNIGWRNECSWKIVLIAHRGRWISSGSKIVIRTIIQIFVPSHSQLDTCPPFVSFPPLLNHYISSVHDDGTSTSNKFMNQITRHAAQNVITGQKYMQSPNIEK